MNKWPTINTLINEKLETQTHILILVKQSAARRHVLGGGGVT